MLDSIKFYQTGSNTIGNRLLNPSMRAEQAAVDRPNTLISGHRACQGCGEALGARYAIDAAMRATGGQLIVANATGCLEVFSTPYPESAWRLPWIHSLFGNPAAVASGIAAAAKVRAAKHGNGVVPRVIAQGGDGGTTDIGFATLSGMFERNDDVLYICYDNQAYMNTGVQRSSATPPAARTATTQLVGTMIKNFLISAVICIVGEIALVIVYVVNSSFFSGGIQKILDIFNLSSHFDNFANAIFDVKGILYFLSVIAVCLFLTVQSIAKRRWN